MLKREAGGTRASRSLLVVPASLLANWAAEIARFAPSLKARRGPPLGDAGRASSSATAADDLAGVDLVITSYGSLPRMPWLTRRAWHLVVLDEAQAIKNPGAQADPRGQAAQGARRASR